MSSHLCSRKKPKHKNTVAGRAPLCFKASQLFFPGDEVSTGELSPSDFKALPDIGNQCDSVKPGETLEVEPWQTP